MVYDPTIVDLAINSGFLDQVKAAGVTGRAVGGGDGGGGGGGGGDNDDDGGGGGGGGEDDDLSESDDEDDNLNPDLSLKRLKKKKMIPPMNSSATRQSNLQWACTSISTRIIALL